MENTALEYTVHHTLPIRTDYRKVTHVWTYQRRVLTSDFIVQGIRRASSHAKGMYMYMYELLIQVVHNEPIFMTMDDLTILIL